MHRALAILLLFAAAAAADPAAEAVDEYLVTATRGAAKGLDLPFATARLDARLLRERSYRTTPQILRDVPGAFVQETAPGQGSPFLRGFTGQRTLLLVDGIRLNNSVFRSGPNQYWSTVDALGLDRVEVVLGPGSVLYGSDAIGGTVQAFTRGPKTRDGAFVWGGRGLFRGATAEQSYQGRVELSAPAGADTGVHAGLSAKHFGDLHAGGGIGTQEHSGYDEWDGDVKIERWIGASARVVAAYQHVRQNNVPRWHRTVFSESFHGTTTGGELRRELDQERWLAYVQLHAEDLDGFVEVLRANVSWQSQQETRDRLRPPARRDRQGFDVGTLGLWVQMESEAAIGRLTYGIEYYRDDVSSFSTSNPVQGPVADDATYDLLGVYVQDVFEPAERWELIVGLRLTYAAADANRVSDPNTGNPISIEDDWTAVVGSVRALYRLVPDRWHLFGGVSQGFRAPNLSDLTRFDTARSNEFEIPAPGLDPEEYVTFELGAKGSRERLSLRFAVFYTLIRDQIVRFPTGNTNGSGDAEVTKDNVGDGYLYGAEIALSVRVRPGWTVFGHAAYQEGKVDTFTTSASVATEEYADRLMPLTAQAGVRWDSEDRQYFAELVVVMADKADKLSPRDEGDTQRIPPGGTPGYGVVHLRGGWRVRERTRIVLAVENLFDKSYRVHGSGHNMPGLQAVLTVEADF